MIEYSIEPAAKLIVVRASAHLVGDDVGDMVARLVGDPNYDPSFDLLADISGVSIFRLARNTRGKLREFTATRPGVRRAIVVGQSYFAQEFAKLFRLACGLAPDKFGVFGCADEARNWLVAERAK
jgi:hypothetical protein